MSATLLINETRRRLQARTDEWTKHLVEHRGGSESDLRRYQGIIEGLKIADADLADAYRELSS